MSRTLRLLADRASFRMICIFSQNPRNLPYTGKHCVFPYKVGFQVKTVNQVVERGQKSSETNNSATGHHFLESPNKFEAFRKLPGRSRNFSKGSSNCIQGSEPFQDSAGLFLQFLPVRADSASSCRFCIFLPFCSFSRLFRCFCRIPQVFNVSAILAIPRKKRPPAPPTKEVSQTLRQMLAGCPSARQVLHAALERRQSHCATGAPAVPRGSTSRWTRLGCDCRPGRLVAGTAAMGNGAAANGLR